jgi:hypothetical protein
VEAAAGKPRSESATGRVRKLLEDNFSACVFVIITCCRDIEGICAPLRRITGFSRSFELPPPSPIELGELFIASCDPEWLSPEVHKNPRRVGLMLQSSHEGYEGRAFARLFAQRISCLQNRQVTLKDIASLDSIGSIESSRSLPLIDGFADRVAWHEAGHAAIAIADSSGSHIPEYLTIIPRRNTLGYMTYSREHCERRQLAYTRSMMTHDLRVSLAGRATEELVYGESGVSDLAAHDLDRAADILERGVLKYGLQFAAGLPDLPMFGESSNVADTAFARVNSAPAWRERLEQEYRITLQIARQNRSLIETIQSRLRVDRILFREDMQALWRLTVTEEQRVCPTAA